MGRQSLMTINRESLATASSASSDHYAKLWQHLDDFIRYNPGSRHRRRKISELLSKLEIKSAIEVGCGNGAIIHLLRQEYGEACRIVGADLSAPVIAQNSLRDPPTEYVQLDIETQALNERFDLVVCSEVLEHLNSRESAMRNLAAMLNEGGYLLVTTPAGPVFATERHWGHTTHPTRHELFVLAEQNNLDVVLYLNWGFPTYLAFKMATNLVASWSLRNFAAPRLSLFARLLSSALYHINFLNFSTSRLGCQQYLLLRRRREY